jgi:hypothetical protein
MLLDRSNECFNEINICDADSLSRVTPGTYFRGKNINKRDRKLWNVFYAENDEKCVVRSIPNLKSYSFREH